MSGKKKSNSSTSKKVYQDRGSKSTSKPNYIPKSKPAKQPDKKQ